MGVLQADCLVSLCIWVWLSKSRDESQNRMARSPDTVKRDFLLDVSQTPVCELLGKVLRVVPHLKIVPYGPVPIDARCPGSITIV